MSAVIIPFPSWAVKGAAAPVKPSAAQGREAKKQALRTARRAENIASPGYDGRGHNPPWCEQCLARPAVTYCHCPGCMGETKLCRPCDKAHAREAEAG